MNSNPVGRPPKVNHETLRILYQSLFFGGNVSTACKTAGISRDTFYRYYDSKQDFLAQLNTTKRRLADRVNRSIERAVSEGDTDTLQWLMQTPHREP